MKKLNLIPLVALMLGFVLPNFAQQTNNGQTTITIIKKYIDENGVETVETTTTTSDENNIDSDSHIFFNSADNNFQGIQLDEMESLTNEISKQLESFEIEVDGTNRTVVTINENNSITSNSSCNSKPTPFLGVVTKRVDNGVMITRIIDESAAKAAGLKEGDIITNLAGKNTNSTSELSCAIKKQEVGKNVSISYIRNGQAMQTSATLGKNTNSSQTSTFKLNKKAQDFMRGNHRSYTYNNNYKVDPCKVFIGVFTSSSTHRSGEGISVNSIIDNTPAQEAGLQRGDIITAMDGISVNNHNELLSQRNTHQQGDQFTITYKRNGSYYTVGAEFKSCKEEETETTRIETPKQETIEPTINDTPPVFNNSNNELDIELRAFPNPTNRLVNVRFEGDKVPTNIIITDVTGKEVFNEYIRNFDGVYNERIDLKDTGAVQGTVIISVKQNGKTASKKVLYIQGRA